MILKENDVIELKWDTLTVSSLDEKNRCFNCMLENSFLDYSPMVEIPINYFLEEKITFEYKEPRGRLEALVNEDSGVIEQGHVLKGGIPYVRHIPTSFTKEGVYYEVPSSVYWSTGGGVAEEKYSRSAEVVMTEDSKEVVEAYLGRTFQGLAFEISYMERITENDNEFLKEITLTNEDILRIVREEEIINLYLQLPVGVLIMNLLNFKIEWYD